METLDELKPAMTFFFPIDEELFSFGLKPSFNEKVFGSLFFPAIHSSDVKAGSSEAVSGKISS